MPDDLAAQIEPLTNASAPSGGRSSIIDGVEADDVIGTLARRPSAGHPHRRLHRRQGLAQLVTRTFRW